MKAWRVFCEHCNWRVNDLDDRDLAIAAGRAHVHAHHADDEEWEFRIQGISRPVHTAARAP